MKLQKKGSNYFGLCPFHHEKSPSFSVSQSKQMYHCFGCGVSGNVFTFVMEYENYSFREAVELLAERSGVKAPEVEYSRRLGLRQICGRRFLRSINWPPIYFYYQPSLTPGRRDTGI